jgi:hypothetical protein
MSEVIGDFTGKNIGPTFFRGSNPIDGVLATGDVLATHACVMPAGYGVGNHQMFAVDFLEESLIGKAPYCIKCFTSCCLNTKISSGATQRYLSQLENNLACHCLIECLGQLHTTHRYNRAFRQSLNKLDR